MNLGQQRLLDLIKNHGKSQADIATAIGVKGDLVSRWLEMDESKRRTKPSLEMAGKLHDAFGIDPLDWTREAEALPESERKPTPGTEKAS